MQSIAAKRSAPEPAPSLACATVQRTEGGLTLEDDQGCYPALRAPSCLLSPAAGDRVLVARTDEGIFVIAVLRRPDTATAELTFEGSARVSAPNGRLDLGAGQGVGLSSAEEVALAAPALTLTAGLGRVVVDKLQLTGKLAQACVDQARLVARGADMVADSVVQRFRTRLTQVKALDRLQARYLHHDAEEMYTLNTRHGAVHAAEQLRMDGKQIIMG